MADNEDASELGLARNQVLVVVPGSYAATVALTWVPTFRHVAGWTVRCILTRMGARMVAPGALAAASGHPVVTDDWDAGSPVPHRELGDWADLILVVGATTNFMAKCAHCMPDSLALTTVIASNAPTVLVPSVPEAVLDRPSYRRMQQLLRDDGYLVVDAVPSRSLYSGSTSRGGIAPLSAVLECCELAIANRVGPGANTNEG